MKPETNFKVTIIVVNYNQGRYITRAIESVIEQTFQDYSILVVDDGSDDDSIQLINKLMDKYPEKIKLIRHWRNQNKGILKTYELALSKVKSEYVAFLEADDWWDKDYLKTKVEILHKFHQVGVVFSGYKVVSKGWYGKEMVFRQMILRWFMKKGRPFDNFVNLLKKNNVATFSAFVTRKSLLDSIKIACYPEVVFYDWWILIQLSMRSLFYWDSTSNIHWRIYKRSTLGKQTMAVHKKHVIRFIHFVYECIDQQIRELPNDTVRKYFMKKKLSEPYFTKFYANPDIGKFLAFFKNDPIWALESFLSYWVNSRKYTR
jgi:glycosyltransferase involved in cell wall biosynthesis